MCAQYRGTTVTAQKYDAKRASTTPKARAPNKYLLTPNKNVTGKNTTTATSMIASTANATSLAPWMAATLGCSPSSMCRYTFSSTTTESSINRENARANP